MCSNDNQIRDVRHTSHNITGAIGLYLKYQNTGEMKNTSIFVNEFKSIARKKQSTKSKKNEWGSCPLHSWHKIQCTSWGNIYLASAKTKWQLWFRIAFMKHFGFIGKVCCRTWKCKVELCSGLLKYFQSAVVT